MKLYMLQLLKILTLLWCNNLLANQLNNLNKLGFDSILLLLLLLLLLYTAAYLSMSYKHVGHVDNGIEPEDV